MIQGSGLKISLLNALSETLKKLAKDFLIKRLYFSYRTEHFEMVTIFWPLEMSDFGAWAQSKWPQFYDKQAKIQSDW